MTPHHHEPDHMFGEPPPGTGILRFAIYAVLEWMVGIILIVGVSYVL